MKFYNRDGRLVDPPTRRLKFTDTSGYIKDRLVEIPHSSCPTHDAEHEQVPQIHLWIEAPARDASNGSYGEQRPGYATGEHPSVPTQRGARQDQRTPMRFPGPNEEGEMPEASFEQGAEPRRLFDRRDQQGRHWNAKIFGPEEQEGEDFPKVEPAMANDARRLLTNLERGDSGNAHVMGLRLLQQTLNRAYARR